MLRKDDAASRREACPFHEGTVQENLQAMCGSVAQGEHSLESCTWSEEEYDVLLFCAFAEEAPLDEGDIPLEIIQYDPTDYFIDGNGQFTFLIGKGVLDVLLRHGREGVASVSGIDVFIDTSLPIAAPGDLKACLGLWVDRNKLFGFTKDNGWFLSYSLNGLPKGAVEMRHKEGDGQEVDTQSGMRGERSAVFAKRYFFIHLTVFGAYDGRPYSQTSCEWSQSGYP